MRGLSLRGWLFFVSVFFAVLVVGGIALTTYVIISDGIQAVVAETAQRIASSADSILVDTLAETEDGFRGSGLSADERRDRALAELRRVLPSHFQRGGLGQTDISLYNEDLELVWISTGRPERAQGAGARSQALETQAITRSIGQYSAFSGLLSKAELPTTVIHMPVRLPFGERGVLDVVYVPSSEERAIDAVRLPMTMLALSAVVVMVVLMQTSMAWVLNLVDDLRKAADSIDAGRLEERLPETAHNEIGELARSLNHLIERLRRRSEAQSRFVADASHELATPVAGIRGYTSILRAWGGEDQKVREEAIEAIDRESRRMARLTSDLLNVLHADQGMRLRSEHFDLNVSVRERLSATASAYIDKDIEFIGPEAESLTMVSDPDRMEDVLSILLDNAAKYTPQRGTVTVDTYRRRELVTIEVTDSGPGIASDDLPLIFDRFYRTDEARSDSEGGFGLGLAIARGIVESMQGTISAESEPGKGATFRVVVPRGRV